MYANTHIVIINNSILIPPYIESVIYLTSFHTIACKFREKREEVLLTSFLKKIEIVFRCTTDRLSA